MHARRKVLKKFKTMPAPLTITTKSDLIRATKGVGSELQNHSLW